MASRVRLSSLPVTMFACRTISTPPSICSAFRMACTTGFEILGAGRIPLVADEDGLVEHRGVHVYIDPRFAAPSPVSAFWAGYWESMESPRY